MKMDHMPGTTVQLMSEDFMSLGEVEIKSFLVSDKAYFVWWTYPQTGDRELIKVPAWRLIRKEIPVVTLKDYHGAR